MIGESEKTTAIGKAARGLIIVEDGENMIDSRVTGDHDSEPVGESSRVTDNHDSEQVGESEKTTAIGRASRA